MTIGEKLRELLTRGEKIQAIKLVRQLTNAGLKESKDAIDSWDSIRTSQGGLTSFEIRTSLIFKEGTSPLDLAQEMPSEREMEVERKYQQLKQDHEYLGKEASKLRDEVAEERERRAQFQDKLSALLHDYEALQSKHTTMSNERNELNRLFGGIDVAKVQVLGAEVSGVLIASLDNKLIPFKTFLAMLRAAQA